MSRTLKKLIIAFIIGIILIAFVRLNDSKKTESINKDSYVSAEINNYVGNVKNKKLHSIHCSSLPYEHNRVYFSTVEEANRAGYTDKHKECMGGN